MISADWLAWMQQTLPLFGDHANNIIPGKLWISDISAAMNYSWLKRTGITHILSVTSFPHNKVMFYPDDFVYYTVRAHDNTSTDIMQYWPATTAFIRNALAQGGRVLVHCKFGRSRSVATVAAYLIAELCYTPQQALVLLRSKREQASPNSFFVFQIYSWGMRHKRHCK